MNLVLHDHFNAIDGSRKEFSIQVYKNIREQTWTCRKSYSSQALLDLPAGMMRELIEKDIELLVGKVREVDDDPTP